MAEALLAGKNKKELSLQKSGTELALPNAVIAWFLEDFFVRQGPGNAGNGNASTNSQIICMPRFTNLKEKVSAGEVAL